jgi:Tfp pilus assembly protein PilO
MRTTRGLVTQIVADYRRLLGPLVIVALVNVGAYALAVYPLTLKVAASQRRAATATSQLRDAQRDSGAVNAMLARTEQADKDLARFYTDVLPAGMSGARRLTYARLAALADERGLTTLRRSFAVDQSRRGRLQRLEITMVVNGDYEDIRDLIYALETAPEFVVIENVELAEGSTPGAGLTASFHLATYYRGGSGGL